MLLNASLHTCRAHRLDLISGIFTHTLLICAVTRVDFSRCHSFPVTVELTTFFFLLSHFYFISKEQFGVWSMLGCIKVGLQVTVK